MDKTIEIEDFLKQLEGEHIVEKHRLSPLPALCSLVAGGAITFVGLALQLPDSLRYLLISIGMILLLLGLTFLFLLFDKKSGRYIYTSTKSRIKTHKIYINSADRELCREILQSGDLKRLPQVEQNINSQFLLIIKISTDNRFAAVQLYEHDMSFSPVTMPVAVYNSKVDPVITFIENK